MTTECHVQQLIAGLVFLPAAHIASHYDGYLMAACLLMAANLMIYAVGNLIVGLCPTGPAKPQATPDV